MHVGHAIADAKAAHLPADRGDDARGLASETRGHDFCGYRPGAVVDVDEVEADGGVLHLHFADARRGNFDVFEPEDFGSSGFVDAYG